MSLFFGIWFLLLLPIALLFASKLREQSGGATIKFDDGKLKVRRIETEDGIVLFELVDPPANVTHTRFFTIESLHRHVAAHTGEQR